MLSNHLQFKSKKCWLCPYCFFGAFTHKLPPSKPFFTIPPLHCNRASLPAGINNTWGFFGLNQITQCIQFKRKQALYKSTGVPAVPGESLEEQLWPHRVKGWPWTPGAKLLTSACESEKLLQNSTLPRTSQQGQPHSVLSGYQGMLLRLTRRLLEEGGSGVRRICSRSTWPWEQEKDLNVPNTDSGLWETPEESGQPCLSDTKAPRPA